MENDDLKDETTKLEK